MSPSAVDEPVTIQDAVDKPVTVHNTADEQQTIRGAIDELPIVRDAVDESVNIQDTVSVISREVLPMKECRQLRVPGKQKCAICFQCITKSNMKRHRKLHKVGDISSSAACSSIMVDPKAGLYLVSKSLQDRNTHCMSSLVLVQPCSASVASRENASAW